MRTISARSAPGSRPITRRGLGRRALEAYERAARHAYRVFALDDCIALLQRALRLLDESPRGEHRDEVELRLLSAIGVPLVARRGYGAPEVRRCYERALTLHRRLGRRPSPSVLRGLALHAVVTCRFDRAEEMGRELIARGGRDRTARVEGEYVLGVTRSGGASSLTPSATSRRRRLVPHRGRTAARRALRPGPAGRVPVAVRPHPALPRPARRRRPHDAGGRARGHRARQPDDGRLRPRLRRDPRRPRARGARPRRRGRRADAVTSAMHIDYFAIIAELLSGWRDVFAGDLRGLATIRGRPSGCGASSRCS